MNSDQWLEWAIAQVKENMDEEELELTEDSQIYYEAAEVLADELEDVQARLRNVLANLEGK